METVAAMQAVFLPDHWRLLCKINAILGADLLACPAAGTGCCDGVILLFGCPLPKGKGKPLDRFLRKVEPLDLPLVQLENRECLAGALGGIDLFHIGVLFQQLGQPPIPQFPHAAPHRDRHAGQGVFAVGAGQGQIALPLQPFVKPLALGREEV